MIDFAALLRRDPISVDRDLIAPISGKRVLITGAGGSIGSEVARQVYGLAPASLALVDRAEGPLYDIAQELSLRNGVMLTDHLVNVASLPAMCDLMDAVRPDIVFHAAAYKHVPMMERHPADAVYTNVGGTLATMRASLAADVERFVLISTDKAVEPSSVLGATKRLAEMAVASVDRPYVSVRFGNVLGSSGSVVPLLARQLRQGMPLTLTDPDMTRYFMAVEEAASLILVVAAIGEPHNLFVLDMGAPIRIGDLADDLIAQMGYSEWAVRIIGLRPGEKRHEALSYAAEQLRPTLHPKVMRVLQPCLAELDHQLDTLVAVAESGDHEKTRSALWGTLEGGVT